MTASYVSPDLFGMQTVETWPFTGLEPHAYDYIMADPPWLYENWSEDGTEKGPDYEMMADADIEALPVADLARDHCACWLWATAPRLDFAHHVLRIWGFQFKTAGAWDKRRWGPGYIWRSRAEFILIGTKGEPRVRGKDICNLLEGGAAEHSRKPDLAYELAERMMPHARRCSLFERPIRPGWEGWGDEYGEPIQRGRRKQQKLARRAARLEREPVFL